MTLISGNLCSCGQQNFKTIDADEFETAISSDSVQLLDVRTVEEYNEAHISADSVINIDELQPDFMTKARKVLDKGKTVAVYCRSGRRSTDAAKNFLMKATRLLTLKEAFLNGRKEEKRLVNDTRSIEI